MISWKDGVMHFDTFLYMIVKPTFCNRWPRFRMGVDADVLFEGELDSARILAYEASLTEGEHVLWIELVDKTNSDTTESADQAIMLQEVAFEKISADRFIWLGEYRPDYPEPWASKQTDLQPVLTNATYLGWNGRWTLRFTAPVFRWMHEVEHLGWIYD